MRIILRHDQDEITISQHFAADTITITLVDPNGPAPRRICTFDWPEHLVSPPSALAPVEFLPVEDHRAEAKSFTFRPSRRIAVGAVGAFALGFVAFVTILDKLTAPQTGIAPARLSADYRPLIVDPSVVQDRLELPTPHGNAPAVQQLRHDAEHEPGHTIGKVPEAGGNAAPSFGMP